MEDIFFRKDNYKNEPWYNEFCIFLNIGVCKPEKQEYIKPMQDALEIMGYTTRVKNMKRDNDEKTGTFILPE